MRNLALSPLRDRLIFTLLYAFGLVAAPALVGLYYSTTAQDAASVIFWAVPFLTWTPLNAGAYSPRSARIGLLALAVVFFVVVGGGFTLVGALLVAAYAIGGGKWRKE